LFLLSFFLLIAPATCAAAQAPAPEAKEGLRLLYSGDADAAITEFRKLQQHEPQSPAGFLLEANARWWKIYCAACDIKWNLIDAFERKKMPGDDEYFALCDKAIALAESQIKKSDTAEMEFFAGMGYALKARLHGLRYEKMPTARAGKSARDHFARAQQLDPSFADALTGLGLYNYYVDTLSTFVKVIRFMLFLPGGSKKEGVKQLEQAMQRGVYSPVEARVYLARNLRNYDQQYERAAQLLAPLVEQFPSNPVFRLLLGDMYAKLGRKEKSAAQSNAARTLTIADPACAARVQHVAQTALTSPRLAGPQ